MIVTARGWPGGCERDHDTPAERASNPGRGGRDQTPNC